MTCAPTPHPAPRTPCTLHPAPCSGSVQRAACSLARTVPRARLHAAPRCQRRFAEGFKITDSEAMATHAVDREALGAARAHLRPAASSTAFNADPHAGNLMVQVREGAALPVPRLRHDRPPRTGSGWATRARARGAPADAAAVQRAVRARPRQSQSEELPGATSSSGASSCATTRAAAPRRRRSRRPSSRCAGSARPIRPRARHAQAQRHPARPHLLLARHRPHPRPVPRCACGCPTSRSSVRVG